MTNNHSIIELTTDEISLFSNLATEFYESLYDSPDLFCKKAKYLSNFIPTHIKNKLKYFSINGSQNGFLLVKTLPNIDVPYTPTGNEFKVGEKTLLARVQAIIISFFSDLISYEAEANGSLFQDIVPTKFMAEKQTSLGSATELEIHTEQAFSKLRPDFISLGCLRGDKNANTYILPVQKVIEQMTKNDIDFLRKPLWNTSVDLSFKLNGCEFIEGDIRGPFSIINGEEFDPLIIFDQDLMKGVCDDSNEMINKINNIYYNDRISHNLTSGEIIIIDNRRALHGRSPFTPLFNGYDRFLVRCFSTLNYEKSFYARINNGRTVAAKYS